MTERQRWLLDSAACADEGGLGFVTGRRHRREVAEQCVAFGWLKNEVLAASEGCFARDVDGYVMTDAGREALRAVEEAEQ
jgi:hypothetical protein